MKQATKTFHKSTATEQVKRVVATIALATAAGTAATPAFAADSESDRGDDGVGSSVGTDRAGAEFGGSERGVAVKDDGTVEVQSKGLLGGVGDALSGVVGGVTDVVEDVTEGVTSDPVGAVGDVTDTVGDTVGGVTDTVGKVADPVTDVVEDVTGSVSAGEAAPGGKAEEGSAGTESGSAEGGATTPDADEKKGGSGKGAESGAKDDGVAPEGKLVKDAAYFAPAEINYSTESTGPVAGLLPVVGGLEQAQTAAELVTFEATAKVLGFSPDGLSGDEESSGYEPRHMKEPASQDDAVDEASGSAPGIRAGLGLGVLDLEVLASGEGVSLRVGTEGVQADIQAGQGGVSVDAGVKDVADVEVGADKQGVQTFAEAVGVTSLDAEVGVSGGTAEGRAAAANGAEQNAPASADRGAQPFETSADSFLEQYPQQSGLAPTGAEFLSYQPSSVDRLAEQADAAAREATIDAPLRVATTGTEAAALTGLAGSLVVGGAGALLVANRPGRNGETAAVPAENTIP